jgi:hypothetical protein
LSEPRDPLIFFTDRDLGARFPDILSVAGLNVRRHKELFAPDCPDDVWLEAIGKEGWIAVSHDTRIRYKPNELAAVVRHGVRLLIVIGKAPFPELAKHFVATVPRITEFVAQHPAPWIAKVYRPQPAELARNEGASGNVSLWYPPGGD